MSARPSLTVAVKECKARIIDEHVTLAPLASIDLGVLAFGDSITNGGGELQWGVALQSWALWVARATGLPYSGYAVDGARAVNVVQRQIPEFERRTAHPGARYELGCLYIGVNDVRALDWDSTAFARDLRTALTFLTARCERTLTLTIPLDLGRPRAGRKVLEGNVIVERVAAELGTLVVDLRDFGARNHLMPDHVHPTAFGQIAIAERTLDVLERDGVSVAARPSSLIDYETTWWRRLRGDATYVYRHAKVSARALRERLAASHPPPSRPAAAERATE
jgi:lysophospholipase L1-like esterase